MAAHQATAYTLLASFLGDGWRVWGAVVEEGKCPNRLLHGRTSTYYYFHSDTLNAPPQVLGFRRHDDSFAAQVGAVIQGNRSDGSSSPSTISHAILQPGESLVSSPWHLSILVTKLWLGFCLVFFTSTSFIFAILSYLCVIFIVLRIVNMLVAKLVLVWLHLNHS